MGESIKFRPRRGPWHKPPSPKWVRKGRAAGRWALGAGLAVAVVVGGLAAHLLTGGKLPKILQPVSATFSTVTGQFALCGMAFGKDCVVDGDTIDVRGQRIRMVDYDTPEISDPRCASEYALGQKAKFRLLELLNSGPVEIRASGARDIDKYGRKLRLVLVNGRSVGDTLVAEGLAWSWEGHRHAWCVQ